MTGKDRWFHVLKNEPVDRLPFWSKILDKSYMQAQVSPFDKMSLREIHEYLQDDILEFLPEYIKVSSDCLHVSSLKKGYESSQTFVTKSGETSLVMQYDVYSDSWHPVVHPIKTVEDIKLMTEWFENADLVIDEKAREQAKNCHDMLGDDAITLCNIGTSALMYFVEYLAGVNNAHFLLADYPDVVEELFHAMDKQLLVKTKMYIENQVSDAFLLTENTSTGLISPNQYHEYCLEPINQCADIVNASGNLLTVHMCGHLMGMLGELKHLRCAAFEAFTSPPLGNTRLIDGKTSCPDKALIGGTNAVLWTKPQETIIEEITKDLEDLPNHRGIAVSASGIMTPLCKPETIKNVCSYIKQFPVRL